MNKSARIMVAVSGASGSIYAKRLLEILPSIYETIYLTASENAIDIARAELGISNLTDLIPKDAESKFKIYEPNDMFAPPASGSHDYDGLIIVPCSMGVVGRIASGISNDLITRAADVCLKERRKLVLVVRETPLSLIHLRNMTMLIEAGAVILPATPAFYNNPQSVGELVDFIVDRIFRAIDADINFVKGWQE